MVTSRVGLYAAIRRDSRAGHSVRIIARTYGVSYHTVKGALGSAPSRHRSEKITSRRKRAGSIASYPICCFRFHDDFRDRYRTICSPNSSTHSGLPLGDRGSVTSACVRCSLGTESSRSRASQGVAGPPLFERLAVTWLPSATLTFAAKLKVRVALAPPDSRAQAIRT